MNAVTNFSAPKRGAMVEQLVQMDALERQASELTRSYERTIRLTPGTKFRAWPIEDLRGHNGGYDGMEIVNYYRVDDCEEALAEITQSEIEEAHRQLILSQMSEGQRPADESSIRQQIAFLLGSFPASTAPDPQIYARAMIAEVSAAQPSLIALDTMCRELRRTLKWPPSIAEVLDGLKEAEALWSNRYSRLQALPKCRANAIAKLTDERNRLAAEQEEKRARIQTEIDRLEIELANAIKEESDPDPSFGVGRSSASIRQELEKVQRKLKEADHGYGNEG
jgi:chromosome segregation ATPase